MAYTLSVMFQIMKGSLFCELAVLICLEVLQVSCLLLRPIGVVFCRQHESKERELPALSSDHDIVAFDFKVMLFS